MTEEEKKAIAYLKSYCTNDVLYDNTHYEQIKILLNLIESQQKETEQKDNIIDAMAEQLTTPLHNKQWVIDYFEGKVNLQSNKQSQ